MVRAGGPTVLRRCSEVLSRLRACMRGVGALEILREMRADEPTVLRRCSEVLSRVRACMRGVGALEVLREIRADGPTVLRGCSPMCVRVCGSQEVLSRVRACVLRGWYSRGSPRDTRGWTDGTQEPLKRAVHVVLCMLAEWLKLCCVVFRCSDGALQVAAYLVLVVARSGRIMLLLRTQA